jgi:hypothetical protein
MTFPSCPQMARLGRLLVDAYRSYEDHPHSPHALQALVDVRLHIITHRSCCAACREQQQLKTQVPLRNSSPVVN